MRAGKNLKWVGMMSAGVENVLFIPGGEAMRDSKIVLTNNKVVQGRDRRPRVRADALPETRPEYSNISRGDTRARDSRASDSGKTAVVIGVGGIGMQIATRAWAFGMNVIGVDPEESLHAIHSEGREAGPVR